MDDRIAAADVAQKLVAQPGALRGAFDEPGNIDKFHDSRRALRGFPNLTQFIETLVRHRHDADIRVNRTERIIRSLRIRRARDGIEERAFPDIWKTDYT